MKANSYNQPAIKEPVLNKAGHEVFEAVEEANSKPLEVLSPTMERPDFLLGSTYKIKTPMSEHALYVTINDVVLNQGTPYEERKPYELFINSKNMDQFQFLIAIARLITSIFRCGCDVGYLAGELTDISDPKGGYFKKGGTYMPSLVAEIGCIVDRHLQSLGLVK